MANGLVPLIKSGKLNIELTSFLEVYIYFYNNNTIGFFLVQQKEIMIES